MVTEGTPNYSGKIISVSWNGYQENIAHAVVEFLTRNGATVSSTQHPLFSDDEFTVRTIIAKSIDPTIRKRRRLIRSPLSYAFDMFYERASFRSELAIFFSCHLAILRIIFFRNRNFIYWTMDYSPRRFKNSVLNWGFNIVEKFVWERCLLHVDISLRALEARSKSRQIPINPTRDKIVSAGVHREYLKYPDSDVLAAPKWVFLGNLFPHVGVTTFLKAFEYASNLHPNLEAVVIGRGPQLKPAMEFKDSLEHGGRIHFYPNLDDISKVRNILSTCCLAFAPYVQDESSISNYSDPGKVKDYLSASLPILISNVPEISSTIAVRGGGEIIGDNPELIAKLALSIIENETEWLYRAKKAHQLALEFDWDVLLTHLFSDLFKKSNHDFLNK